MRRKLSWGGPVLIKYSASRRGLPRYKFQSLRLETERGIISNGVNVSSYCARDSASCRPVRQQGPSQQWEAILLVLKLDWKIQSEGLDALSLQLWTLQITQWPNNLFRALICSLRSMLLALCVYLERANFFMDGTKSQFLFPSVLKHFHRLITNEHVSNIGRHYWFPLSLNVEKLSLIRKIRPHFIGSI